MAAINIYIVLRKKHSYFYDYNSSVSWSILILFIPIETEMNILQRRIYLFTHLIS